MRTHTYFASALAMLAISLMIGCQTAPKSEAGKADLEQEAHNALSKMKAQDPGLADTIDKGHGYVIFPTAGKGGLIVGGGYGRGVVYNDAGAQIGFADITQVSAGAQIGGQAFYELIVFENQAALDRFKTNQLTFAANASAVAVKSGAAASANYENGVKVFTLPTAGLMAEASIGGQKFTFTPSGGSGQPSTRPAQPAAAREEAVDSDKTVTTETKIESRRETD
jgi:lipid-binding SYLF domain-containing protein